MTNLVGFDWRMACFWSEKQVLHFVQDDKFVGFDWRRACFWSEKQVLHFVQDDKFEGLGRKAV